MLLDWLAFNSKTVVRQSESTDQTIPFSMARASAEEIEPQINDSEKRDDNKQKERFESKNKTKVSEELETEQQIK